MRERERAELRRTRGTRTSQPASHGAMAGLFVGLWENVAKEGAAVLEIILDHMLETNKTSQRPSLNSCAFILRMGEIDISATCLLHRATMCGALRLGDLGLAKSADSCGTCLALLRKGSQPF